MLTFSKNKENENALKDIKERNKQKHEEYVNALRAKMGLTQMDSSYPLSPNFSTFDHIMLQKGIKGTREYKGSKSNKGFGLENRFEEDPQKKWLNKIERYNKTVEKKLNPLQDQTPSPAAYSLISVWAKPKGKKEERDSIKCNYMNVVSRGPSVSIYHE